MNKILEIRSFCGGRYSGFFAEGGCGYWLHAKYMCPPGQSRCLNKYLGNKTFDPNDQNSPVTKY